MPNIDNYSNNKMCLYKKNLQKKIISFHVDLSLIVGDSSATKPVGVLILPCGCVL